MTIAVDFDGVIHTYEHGWHDGSIYGDFMKDALVSLLLLTARREPVFILTAREPRSVARWLEKQSNYTLECTTRLPRKRGKGLRRGRFWNKPHTLLVTNYKMPARIYVDDRACRFESWAQTMLALAEVENPTP